MNIALTGSSGKIGSHLLADFKKMGHEVLCISSSRSSHDNNTFLYEELESEDINFKADYIFHLASINSNLEESEVTNEISLIKSAINCMESLDCKNFIFFSTIKVYGDNSFGSYLIDENSPIQPKCFYGKAKANCELELINSAKTKNFNYFIFRLPPVLINHPQSNLGRLFYFVEQGLPIPSFHVGDANCRSFLNYDLLIDVLKIVLNEQAINSNKIYNLADNDPISTNDLLRWFAKSTNKKLRIIYLPNFFFTVMMNVNLLQLILCRLFGNFHLSNEKLRKDFKLP
ncbi:NAD-dependent epimerase/dehydratase family protein [Pseudomonadota bacterium]|nr:NAD-dependent epimerase/dehydratase family protein [Pseudomonadota bacterium]